MKEIWKKIDSQPYMFVMIIALILRLIAAIFSKGYGMHDDHFLVIEAAKSWADGYDYNSWLPWNQIDPKPEGHSFFYVGIHYLIFSMFKFLGINSPVFEMFLIRMIHALFSLITVSLTYKITEMLSCRKIAFQAGILMAALWFMPFFSVRNLVEIISIPFLLTGIYLIVKSDIEFKNGKQSQKKYNVFLIAGLIMGIAFSVRYQTVLFIGGTGLVLLIQRKWKEMLMFGTGSLISILFFQSVVDYFIWGYPFAEFTEYVKYNLNNRYSYLTGDWYMYLGVLFGLFLFPLGLFLLFGYFRTWKKHLLIFLPSFIFLAFHSYFPNKQERFIFTIIPFIVILGMIGWDNWIKKSVLRKKISNYGMVFFWIINTSLLGLATTAYSKKARIEAMNYLSKYEVSDFLTECTGDGKMVFMPRFYSGQWPHEFIMQASENLNPEMYKKNIPTNEFRNLYKNEVINALKTPNVHQNSKQYLQSGELRNIDFVLFVSEDKLQDRVELMKGMYPELSFEYKAEPGLMDRIVHYINPVNKNQEIFIYSTKAPERRNR
jgi:hypothetical protein